MLNNSKWFTRLTFFIAAVLVSGGLGYYIGQPEYCCQFPGNKDFIDYIAAWSGPIGGLVAIGIALFSDIRTRQFRKQDRSDQISDKNAENNKLEANAVSFLLGTLIPFFHGLHGVVLFIEDMNKQGATIKPKTAQSKKAPNIALPDVPAVLSLLGPRALDLPSWVVGTITLNERYIQFHVSAIRLELNSSEINQKDLKYHAMTAREYTLDYMAQLLRVDAPEPDDAQSIESFLEKVYAQIGSGTPEEN